MRLRVFNKSNRTKVFHVKRFGKVGAENLTRRKTTRRP
jgi:hypothetical protein